MSKQSALRDYLIRGGRSARHIGLQAAVALPAAAAVPTAEPRAADDAATALPEGKSFTVYFDFDDAEFDMNQIGVVQDACGYAATLPSAEFVLAGHADTMGPEPYNDRLSLARAQSVASVIRNDPRFRDALNVIRFGERDLAVPTQDDVEEPENRRVVITVVPGKAD
jgi:OOP family OmpA-OmpF porin